MIRVSPITPLLLLCCLFVPLSPHQQSISSFVTRHTYYNETLHELENKFSLTAQSLLNESQQNSFHALRRYKEIMRMAARIARGKIFADDSLPFSSDTILTSCSRAVMSNDIYHAQLLLQHHTLARNRIRVSSSASSSDSSSSNPYEQVVFHSAERFSSALSSARHARLSDNISDLEHSASSLQPNSSKRRKISSRIQHVSNILRQWVPISIFFNYLSHY